MRRALPVCFNRPHFPDLLSAVRSHLVLTQFLQMLVLDLRETARLIRLWLARVLIMLILRPVALVRLPHASIAFHSLCMIIVGEQLLLILGVKFWRLVGRAGV